MINSLIRLIGSLIAFGLITANGYAQKKPRMIRHNVLMNGVEWVSPDGKWLVQRVGQYDLQLLDRSTGNVEHEFTSRGFHEQKFQLGRFTSDSKAFVLVAGTGNNFSELDITRYDIPQKEVRTGTARICDGYETATFMGVSSDGNRMAVKFIEKSFGKPHKVNGNPTEGNNPNKFETRIEVYNLTTLQLFKQIVIKDPDVEVFVDEDVSFLIWSDKKVVKDYLPTYQGGYYGSLLDGESSKVVLEKNIKVKDFFASTIYLKRIDDHFFVWHRGKSPLAWNKDEPIYLSVFDKEFNILEQVPVSKDDETAYVLRHISKNGLWLLTAKKPLTEKFENEGGERQPEIECKKAYALRYVGYDGAYIDTINYLPKVIDAVRSILPNQRITFKRSGIVQDQILFPVDVDFSNGKEYRYYTNYILKDFIGYTKNENFLYPENDLMVVPQSITQDTTLYYSTVNIRSMTKELDVPLATVRGYEPPASKPKVSYIKKRVVCFGCGGKGVYPTSGTQTCDVCNGARYYGGTCNACNGTGREQKFTRTTYVNGYTGQQYGSSTVNTGGFCRPCAGSGKVSGKCYNCGGLGVVGAPGPCPYCNSTGYRTEYTEVIEE